MDPLNDKISLPHCVLQSYISISLGCKLKQHIFLNKKINAATFELLV